MEATWHEVHELFNLTEDIHCGVLPRELCQGIRRASVSEQSGLDDGGEMLDVVRRRAQREVSEIRGSFLTAVRAEVLDHPGDLREAVPGRVLFGHTDHAPAPGAMSSRLKRLVGTDHWDERA